MEKWVMCLLIVADDKQEWFDIMGDSDGSRQEQEACCDIKLCTISDSACSTWCLIYRLDPLGYHN